MSDVKEITYPLNRVVATLDASEHDALLDALTSAGVPREGISVITPDDIGNIDSPLTETGVTGFMHRAILSFGIDLQLLEELRSEVVEQGRIIVTVPVDDDDEKAQALEVLRGHNPHTLKFVGRWTVEQL